MRTIVVAILISITVGGLAQSPIRVIAHRGAHEKVPENTLQAIQGAIELKCDYVEIDVRETKDGKLVLMHDARVDRTTSGVGWVKDLSFGEIRALEISSVSAGAKLVVPTFKEALKLCRGRIGVLVDNKAGSPEKVVQALRETEMMEHAVVYSSVSELRQFRELAPGLAIQPPHPDDPPGMADFLHRLKPETVDGHLNEWTIKDAETCRKAGVEIWVDVLGAADNPAGYQRAMELNVDVIQTDHPEATIRFLKKAGRR